MVSTTLTTIAAGQPTSSSSNYHHHHQSTNATGIASFTPNSNSNYQKAQHQLQHQNQNQSQQQIQHHSSSSTTTSTTSASATNTHNSYHHYSKNYSSAYVHKSCDETQTANQTVTTTLLGGSIGGGGEATACTDESNRNLTHQYQQRPSSALYGEHQRGGNQSSTRPEEHTTPLSPHTAYTASESAKLEQQTTKTPRNEIVNLSQALLLSSSPLNDQISLLFPKCRPKHATSNGNINSSTNSGSNIDENRTASTAPITENHKSNLVEPDLLSNTFVVINGNGNSPIQQPKRLYNSVENFRSPTTKAAINTKSGNTGCGSGGSIANKHFYRSVNIITQSPPPPSTSSVSSESLSSVTPRISTNPFLCTADLSNGGSGNTRDQDHETHNKPHEVNENSFQEELPVPTYRTFYYHTSSTNSEHQKARNQQRSPRDEDYHKNEEMPRKRNNYNGSSGNGNANGYGGNNSDMHGTRAAALTHQFKLQANDNQQQHHQHLHQQQQLRQIHASFNNGSNSDTQQSNQSQNPFIRETYWDGANNAQTRHNIKPANTLLNSPETELPLPIYGATSSSSRRAFHQQTYSNANGEAGNMSRATQQQQQQEQHTIRLVRSPINLNETLPASFAESSKSSDHYIDQATLNSCADGPTPPSSHYALGGRGAAKERAREQDVRDKRDVGQFQQPLQAQSTQSTVASIQQHQQQQQQQPQSHRQQQLQQNATTSTRNITEGRLSMISNGEVVVFDDITESWQNLKVTTDTNAPRLSPTALNGAMATLSSKTLQPNTLTVIDINDELAERRHHKSDEPTIMLREHKKFVERTGSILNSPLNSRHGIIEYEGSPRRIGYGGNNTPDDERLPLRSEQNIRNASSYNNTTNSVISNSPQQYPARPGFPQRITSPPRETTPVIMIPSYSNNAKGQIDSKIQQQIQQQQPTQPQPLPNLLLQQQSPTDNNAEDTSNDVSEIGTISDLTTPEAISAAAALAAINNPEPIPATATTPTAPTSTLPTSTQNTGVSALTIPTKSSTFDYLYEFSETRKVLEEFFKCPSNDEKAIEDSSDIDSVDIQYEFHSNLERDEEVADVDAEEEDDDDDDQLEVDNEDDDEEDLELRNATQQNNYYYQQQQHQQQQHHQQQQQQQQQQLQTKMQQVTTQEPARYQYSQQQQHSQTQHHRKPQPQPEPSHKNFHQSYGNHRRRFTGSPLMRDFDFFLDSASRSSCEQIDQQDDINQNQQQDGRNNYRYSPETTDYDSNCGDADSISGDANGGGATTSNCSNYAKIYASSMPVLEDGLSSGHTSDNEINNHNNNFNTNLQQQQQQQSKIIHHAPIGGGISVLMDMKRVPINNSLNGMNNVTSSTADGGGGGNVEKLNSISPNILHDVRELTQMRKLESPINNIGLVGVSGIHEDSMRDAGRMLVNRENYLRDIHERELLGQSPTNNGSSNKVFKNIDPDLDALYSINVFHRSDLVQMTPPPPAPAPHRKPNLVSEQQDLQQNVTYSSELRSGTTTTSPTPTTSIASAISSTLNRNRLMSQQNNCMLTQQNQLQNINRSYQQQQQPPPIPERNLQRSPSPTLNSPVWLPRHLDNSVNKNLLENSSANHSKNQSADEEDIDTDLETDRLLGHQRLDDQGYYEENKSWERTKSRSLLSKISPKQQLPSTKTRNGYNALLSSTPENPPPVPPKNSSNKLLDISGSMSSSDHSDKSPLKSLDTQDCGVAMGSPEGSNNSTCLKKDLDTVGGTNTHSSGIGGGGGVGGGNNSSLQHNSTGNGGGNSNSSTSGNESGSNVGSNHTSGEKKVKKSKNKEGGAVLIEGVLFRAKYLGSTQLVCEGQPTKSTRMMQAEEAVSRIKAPDSDVQPSTEVDLFISTEKIMVLNTDLKEIMMDHALRTISYIADIGDLVVLMARRRFVPQDIDDAPKPNRTPKMICHVFESDEAQFIAQSIGQAFQVAYMEFLKANGIEDHSFVKEMDYQEVLNSQEIFGDELEIFAKKELQKEVVVPKAKGEILGVVIVESGWGSMLPTVVIANLMSSGAAARCGQLNIGDQLIAINGLSLVGLPLSTCQNYIKNTKNQTVVKFTVVPCPPVVEVKIKRPNTKYQLGFSVQNGVICSLLRGGIAERGGVRVGHRIIEINNQSVVAVPHEKIVNLLATSVGEILMKTMPTSMFRLLTGQENPIYI